MCLPFFWYCDVRIHLVEFFQDILIQRCFANSRFFLGNSIYIWFLGNLFVLFIINHLKISYLIVFSSSFEKRNYLKIKTCTFMWYLASYGQVQISQVKVLVSLHFGRKLFPPEAQLLMPKLFSTECDEVTGCTVAWSGKHEQGLGCVVQRLAPVMVLCSSNLPTYRWLAVLEASFCWDDATLQCIVA